MDAPAPPDVVRLLTEIRDRLAGPEPLLVDAADAARLLGVGERTFYRMVSAGDAPPAVAVPQVTHPRWRVADLRKWVEARKPRRRQAAGRRVAEDAA